MLGIIHRSSHTVSLLSTCRKAPVEENSKPEESDSKNIPAEVKTVPNEATQTNASESKAWFVLGGGEVLRGKGKVDAKK